MKKRRLRNGILGTVLALVMVIGTFSGIVSGTLTKVYAANKTITWVCSNNGSNYNYVSNGTGKYKDQDISVTGTGSYVDFSGEDSKFGFCIYDKNSSLTFTSTDDNISKIVINAEYVNTSEAGNLSDGWTVTGTTLTWSGTPRKSVTLSITGTKFEVYGISSIVFTIELPAVTSNVTLNTNGGTINSGDITTYEEGTGATLPTDVTKDGYTFDGWYDNSDLSGNPVTSISTAETGAKVYWAKWTVNTYTITYENLLDGTNPNTISSYTIEDTITFENPTRTGYTGSWNLAGIASGSTGNKTITAVWEINKYKVTFKDYNGNVLKTQENVEYNTSATAPADPTRDGYTFKGWDKEFTNITDNTTVTATYSINSYTVTWTNYDDSVLNTDTANYGETPAYTGATPTKPATAEYTYTFVGWTPEVNNVTGDVTYQATYTQTEIKKDDGEKAVSTEVKKDDKSPEVKVANLTDDFAESILSSEEKAVIDEALNNGEDVKVGVYLEIEDISDTISASDQEKVKTAAANADKIEFFDISLSKEISIDGRSQGEMPIHNLTTPLKLTIGVPKSFPAVADGYTRTYAVLRLHEGSVTELPTTLNSDGTLSFETDKFSTYALAYTDTKEDTSETATTTAATTATTTVAASTSDATTASAKAAAEDKTAPKTGDSMPIAVLVVLMLAAAGALAYMDLKKKKN